VLDLYAIPARPKNPIQRYFLQRPPMEKQQLHLPTMITVALYRGGQKVEERRRRWHNRGWGVQWGRSRTWALSICEVTGTSGPGRGFLSTCRQQTPLCNVCTLGVTAGAGTAHGTPALTLRSLHLVAGHLLIQATIQAGRLAACEK